MELVEEYPFVGMFSTSGGVCMVALLYSCSSVKLSPPACHQAENLSCPAHQTVLKQATLSQLRDLRVILNQGGDNLTNADVVDAVKVIQQWTKRKSSNQEVFKFQDVSILLWVSLLFLSSSFIFTFIKPESCMCMGH